MSEILLYYRRPDPTTWVYMSSFLTIGLYFVFHRFWSIRNLDILLLILLAPGLLMVHEGRRRQLGELESEAIAARESEATTQTEAAETKVDSGAMPRPAPPPPKTSAPLETNSPQEKKRAFVSLAVPDASQPDPSEPVASEPVAISSPLDTAPALFLLGPLAAVIQVDDASGEDQSPANGDPADDPEDPANTNPANTNPANTSPKETTDVVPEIAMDDATATVDETGAVTLPSKTIASGRYAPRDIQRLGFISLFVVQAFILLRMLLDPLMVRRPLLDPNLSTGGLNFIGISLFIFMMANIVNSTPRIQVTQGPELGPGYALMNMLPAIPTRPVSDALGGDSPPIDGEMNPSQARLAMIAKVLAILAHMAIVTGIVLIGSRHFSNLRAGVGCATLYLLLPYTAQMTGRVDHAIPAALLLWAVLMYRKPMVAGIFLGLAGGLVYYPLFLLPLWFSFYWQRGARRLAVGVIAMLALLMLLLSLAGGTESLVEHLRRMFGLFSPNTEVHELRGLWGLGWNPIWRLPVIVGFVILSVFFAVWPAQKNLGTLISGSAVVMVAAQFWHGYGGGLYIAWFLPLLLLTIFRPNLQDRVATKVVDGPRGNPAPREPRLEVEGA